MENICPYTKQSFNPKRSNQKFITPMARIAYHNSIAKNERNHKLPTIKVLKNNYNILDSLLKNSDFVIKSEEFLKGAGFNFNQMTSFIAQDGMKTAVIFDLGYQKTPKGNYKIINCG